MRKYLIAVLLVLVAFFAFGIYKVKERKAELAKLEKPKMIPFTVSAAEVKEGKLEVFRTFRAYYEAVDKGVLSTKVGGIVLKLSVREGDGFKKGEPLALVDPTELKTKLEAAKAKLEALKTSAEAAKLFYRTQKAIYERNLKLYKSGGLSEEALQLSESSFRRAEAQYKSVLAQIEATEAEIKNLEENLERYSKIIAPYDGKVIKLYAREGSFVGPGRPVLGIEREGKYRLLVEVPKETEVGKKAILTFEGKTLKLSVSRVFPAAERDLKVVEVETTKLPVPTESFVSVDLQVGSCEGYIVPSDALLYLEKGTFVVDAESKAHRVEVLALSGGRACVKGDLKGIKQVLVAGQYRLREIALHRYPIMVKENRNP